MSVGVRAFIVPLAAGVAAALVCACGGGSDKVTTRTTPTTTTETDPNPNRHVSGAPGGEDDDDNSISLEGTKGHLEKHQIDSGMKPHLRALTGCYTRRIGSRRYIGGELSFKFQVSGEGKVDKVYVTKSTLGAHDMEQCMLEVSRKMTFVSPRGRKTAEFTWGPLTLNGTQATTWWDAEKGEKEVAKKVAKLKKCAKDSTDPQNVFVTVYVGTRGKVLSVGFASPAGPISDKWAKCAADTIAKWQLADPLGQIAKAGFRYNPE